ncbi:HNH endonuclease (plasmid) [Bacillus sp. JAS24-2]|uniref:HNH endonuclease signature motif containing protein n=1 Tax=Bacillus sp. JAS24-2 TaxID=2217832 RepID=UPI0011EFE08C|nr:HNH endonuclease signature motif containing protein [Bacillus sp. JAS24-2]QEL82780.1 HNH endonuclease [Bacillus sp. JAS24-2]
MDNTMRNRLRTGQTRGKTTKEYTRNGNYARKDKGTLKYFKQNKKALRYCMERPVIPVSLIQSKPPMIKKNSINKYTPEGRSLIHKKLENGVTDGELRWLRNNPITGIRGSIELNDNRISLYVAQVGKCAVSGIRLNPHQMHVHHKNMWSQTKGDSYKNLAILHPRIHQLVHATSVETIQNILKQFALTDKQINKLNKLRKSVGNEAINQIPA